MTDFVSTQGELASARRAYEEAQLAVLQAASRARQAQLALDLATRATHAQHGGGDLAGLQAAAQRAGAAREAAKASLRQSRAALSEATGRFGQFNDPRRSVARWSAASPILFFPVRIETRFRTIGGGQQVPGIAAASSRHQLWVRIYPDDCSIDTFEPLLSDAELVNVKTFWLNLWRAGGIENDERGAWRNLVAAHGSGRAGWLADHFQPTNPGDKPLKVETSDEALVIASTAPPATTDAAALVAYWTAVWRAGSAATKLQAARTALDAAVGALRADTLIAAFTPFNLADKPTAPATWSTARVSVSFVIFPADPDTNLQSWSQAPRVRQFPDRFVVVGFNNQQQTLEAIGNPVTLPLMAGPDPSGDPLETIHPDGADLFVPDELQWMVDFQRAVDAGMALAIDLTADQAAAGFDLLLVLGLQMSASAQAAASALQELLAHHQIGRSGFALVSQGTPAHNTSGASSGHSRDDDPDASFDDRKHRPLFTVTSDPLQKADGQWLAEFLGIDPAFVAGVHGSDGIDQRQARAMQAALWPATLGYWMNTLFTPTGGKTSIFSDTTIDYTRRFFTQFVCGRGALPAVRIGGQPYGILPVTVFSRIRWYEARRPRDGALPPAFLSALYSILRELGADWSTMGRGAHWVGEGGDAHQTLLNVLGHHPSSVEYYSRTAESLAQLYNTLNFWALGPSWWQAILSLNLQAQAVALLQRLGYTAPALPDLLSHFYLSANPQLNVVIDDRPLSETAPIRAYTDAGKNYIQWLLDAAASLDTLRVESGFSGNKSPQALLYLYLRHALMLGYYDASYNYHRNTGVFAGDALLSMRTEAPFIHVADTAAASESRFAALYKTEARITGSASQLVSEFIAAQIGVANEAAVLAAQVDSLGTLASATTAQLERLFAEHIDVCSYRYDAWLLGLVSERLVEQRAAVANQETSGGLFLGAYAWIEQLRPSTSALTPAQIPADIAAQFAGKEALMVDSAGGGYVHAPSMQHAGTAAILRSGYLANASAANPDTLAVNLSSDRVRVALGLIEGIRNGQSLGALLGYRFERGLHDAYALAKVDKFIYPLRKAFPLAADALASTKTEPDIPIEAIEARNVLDGKKLLDRVKSSGIASYPYGLATLAGVSSAAEQQALDDQTAALLDTYDAIADLALAEGVHQAVQGNYDRVASTMEAYTTGNFPPEPQVVQTPPTGIGVTHRFAVQFAPGLTAPAGATPRARAEPAVDHWVEALLPPLADIGCTVAWRDPVSGNPQQHIITLADLKLRPLDVVFLLSPDNTQAMTELDDRILGHTASTWNPRPDAAPQIHYLDRGTSNLSMFEAGPLLRELRALVTQSRPLRASDVRRANDARRDDNADVFADETRIATPNADLKTLGDETATYLATLSPLLADTTTNRATIIAGVDACLQKAAAFLARAASFAMPSSGWGFTGAWLRVAFSDLLAAVSALVARWNDKLKAFHDALVAYDALPAATSDADRFAALQAAELLVNPKVDPLTATPAALRLALDGKGIAMGNRRDQFAAIASTTTTSFVTLWNAINALSTTEFDSQPFDVSAIGDRAVTVTEDVARVLQGQSTAIAARTAAVDGKLADAASSGSSSDRVLAVQAAAKALLGDDFQMVPEFTVSAAQGGEWANALAQSTGGTLLDYLKSTLKIDLPVDEWLYGAARVRPVLRSWESALMLQNAFGLEVPSPVPIQLPFAADAPWLALQYPDDYVIDSDRLLYTCVYTLPFDRNARQCGLLLDEWTEVIPVPTRDTAVTFNYDRPDNEPPQSMLLMTSPVGAGNWQWVDIVDALIETLELAKKRAVEPSMLDPTVYSRFLPATVTASTSYEISIATTLTAVNGAFEAIQGGGHA